MEKLIKQMALRLPVELHRRIAHKAVDNDMNVHQCVIALLEVALAGVHDLVPKPAREPKEA